MSIHLHQGDLPDGLNFGKLIAVDTETMGLNYKRDRLCLVQISSGDGEAHLVQFQGSKYDAPNLKALMADESVTKIYHYARFDLATMRQYLGIMAAPVYCTKIASKLARTSTDRHGLKDLCKDLIGVEISKQQQSSDWGAEELSEAQMAYAASDVLYLHQLKEVLDKRLKREGRTDLAGKLNAFLPVRAQMDLDGWLEVDIFAHA